MASGRSRTKSRRVSRRDAMRMIGVTAGAVAAARRGFAQGSAAPTTVTNPPRDFGPDAPPSLYFTDPDVRHGRSGVRRATCSRMRRSSGCGRAGSGSKGPAWSSVGRYLVFSDIPNNRQCAGSKTTSA